MTDHSLATLKTALSQNFLKAARGSSKGKIHAYAHFMVDLAKLVKSNGALDPKISEHLKKQMRETGISPARARRYIDNSVGSFKGNPDILKAARSPEGAKLRVTAAPGAREHERTRETREARRPRRSGRATARAASRGRAARAGA